MFERYTERARRVLFFARYEASQLGSKSIETEHLLLGVIREGRGLASRIFGDSHISLEEIRKEIEERVPTGETMSTSVEIPFGLETHHVLHHAADEADRLTHSYIGVEHLLLGLLREEQGVAASILAGHGLKLEAVRDRVVRLLSGVNPQVAEVEHVADVIRELENSWNATIKAHDVEGAAAILSPTFCLL